jgi:GntR family transcriptional regulator, transcriptional repressor for pyruvate dehydrogenase complex
MSRTQHVAERLRDAILRGDYAAGDRLPPERELAEQLGVGRSSVREAFKKLEQLGLVEIRHGDGALVRPLQEASLDILPHLLMLDGRVDVDLLEQWLEAREELMSAAVGLAAARASDTEFDDLRERLSGLIDPGIGDVEYFDRLAALEKLVSQVSRNLILRLVRVGLGGALPRLQTRRQLRPPLAVLEPLVKELEHAIHDRDPAAAQRAARGLFRACLGSVLAGLAPASAEGESS